MQVNVTCASQYAKVEGSVAHSVLYGHFSYGSTVTLGLAAALGTDTLNEPIWESGAANEQYIAIPGADSSGIVTYINGSTLAVTTITYTMQSGSDVAGCLFYGKAS